MRALAVLALCLLIASAQGKKHHHDKEQRDNEEASAPSFCRGKACPKFETLKEWGQFAVRRYAPSTWAAVCIHDAHHEEAIMRASAELMNYIHGGNEKEKELWGGTPWAHHVSLGQEHVGVWEATANNYSTILECMHPTICVGYYLPEKYQGDKRPPRPHSESVRVVRVPRWLAFVSQFDGFPSKFRMIFHYMRMVRLLRIHRVPFNWRVALSFVYDPPYITRPEDRHNEVLVPARRLDQLFGEDAEDLFADEKRVLPAKTTALQAIEEEEAILAAIDKAPKQQQEVLNVANPAAAGEQE